jgi:hypothetical protein
MITTPSVNKQSPVKSAILVVCLLGLILTSIFLSRRSLSEVQNASASIYNDRLVPSGILVNLTSTVYRKRLLLESYVLTPNKPDKSSVSSMLDRLNDRIDSLLSEFERTKLTNREADQLQLLKQRLRNYKEIETQLSTNRLNSSDSQQALLAATGNKAFGLVAQTLDELSALQLTIGEDLLSGSRQETNYSYVLTALQIGLVLMIGLSLVWHRL